MKLNIITLVIILAGLAVILVHALAGQWTPLRVLGAAVAIPSFLLLVVARIQLGRAFSVSAKATELVTTGLYSRIRNPIYLFSTLGLAGIILYSGRLWLFLLLAALAIVQFLRSRKEEQVLTQRFGSAYLEYKRTTWF